MLGQGKTAGQLGTENETGCGCDFGAYGRDAGPSEKRRDAMVAIAARCSVLKSGCARCGVDWDIRRVLHHAREGAPRSSVSRFESKGDSDECQQGRNT